jgi:hypothetical protein
MGILYNRYDTSPAPQEYTVTITIDSYINHTGGALVQTNLSGPMTPVTISPQDTYRINQPSGSSGITVAASGNNFIISGTPTADVTINCTTTRNPDLLTATQKNVANWTGSNSSTSFGYQQDVSSTRINWEVNPRTGNVSQEGYRYNTSLAMSTVPNGNYIFEIRYRITDLSRPDDGCKVGICSNRNNGSINNTFKCSIDILDTQTTYTTVSVPYTRSNGQDAYLAITNVNWQSNSTSRQGRIYLDSISLREV